MSSMQSKRIFFQFYLLFVLFYHTFALCPPVKPSIYQALTDLYYGTKGDGWKYPPGATVWNMSALPARNPCDAPIWFGISCITGPICAITSLQFDNINMIGRLSDSFGNLVNMTILQVNNNVNLKGSLPASIAKMTNLNYISFNNNGFTGTLPTTWGNFTRLTTIFLSGNKLQGSIPSTWSSGLKSLMRLTLSNNQLTNTLPSNLFYIPRLSNFDISSNHIVAPIPTSILRLKMVLKDFRISDNLFTGPLPEILTQLSFLTTLWISNNYFDTLPNTFNTMVSVRDLQFDNNLLFGTFPSTITTLTKLGSLNIYNNFLSQSLPSTFGLVTKLSNMNFFNNYFTGKVPKPLFQNNTYLSLDLHANFFSGTIPNGRMPGNVYYFINNNLFSGSLPSFYSLQSTVELRFDNNLLSGSIADANIAMLQQIQICNLSLNYFTGTIPSTISKLTTLTIFDVRSNNMIGTIGTVFHTLPKLSAINLQNNFFEGNLDNVFNISTQLSLSILDFSDNQLTGEIPLELFQLPYMEMISLTKNCFTMSKFPSTICDAKGLVLLSLDGMHTEPVCQERIFPDIPQIKTFQIRHPLDQALPSCLFTDLHNLTILHISGNSVQGPLPDVDYISPSLVDLTLSHNQLTGSIPLIYQQHPWQILDLSFNKFYGTLLPQLSRTFLQPKTSLQLQNNRLSGTIPTFLRDAYDIEILEGNIFACNPHKSTLPLNDSLITSYNCGSEVADNSIYNWLAWIASLALAYLVLVYVVQGMKTKHANQLNSSEKVAKFIMTWIERDLSSYWQIYNSKASFYFYAQEIFQFYEFGAILREVRSWCARVTLLIFLVFFPMYPLLSLAYSTYTHTYAWTLSLGFLSGTTPSVLVLVFMILLLMVLFSEWFSQYSVNLYYLSRRMIKKQETIHRIVQSMKTSSPNPWHEQERGGGERVQTSADMDRLSHAVLPERKSKQQVANIVLDNQEDMPNFINPMLLKKYKQELKQERLSKRQSKAKLENQLKDEQLKFDQEQGNEINSPIHASDKDVAKSLQQRLPRHNRHEDLDDDDDDDELFDPLSLEAWKQSQKQLQQDIELSWKWYLVMIGGLIVNVVVVLAVNMSFVALMNNKATPSSTKQLISFLVSIFKILWNSMVMEGFQGLLVSTLPGHQDHGESIITAYMLWISLFNNIIVPCIAVAVISSDCFYYAFVRDEPVITVITLPQCDGYSFTSSGGLQCVSIVNVDYTTQYYPPYTYSYQCSSSILTSFVDIFIYRFLITTFVNPLMVFPLKYLQTEIYHRYGEKSYLYLAITSAIPPLLLPLASKERANTSSATAAAGIELQDVDAKSLEKAKDEWLPLPEVMKSNVKKAEKIVEEGEVKEKTEDKKDKDEVIVKFKAKNTIINLISDIAILLTFGVIFPPIALVGCFSIVSNTIFIQVALGRLVVLSRTQPELIKSILRINTKCGGIRWLFMNSLKSLSLLLGLFWSCFLVDIYGDVKGWEASVWIFAVMCCMPVIIYITNRIQRYCFPQNWQLYWTQPLVLRPEVSIGNNKTPVEEKNKEEEEEVAVKKNRAASVRFSMIYPSAT